MVRVRFAPSPTGDIHIGNVRAALFNYIFAKKNNGTFILRFEDTDLERSTKESEEGIIKDLKWLGIIYNEGPDIGGDFGPYKQTQRLELYQKYAQQLLDQKYAYRCFCGTISQEEVEEEVEMGVARSEKCSCKNLSEEEIRKNIKENKPFAIRFNANKEKVIVKDLVFGEIEKEVEDFIILKSNNIPTYHFGVVIDDSTMKVTNVIRGQDHLSNTAKQVILYKALGWEAPVFAHYSLTFGLSKRDKSKSIKFLREQGYLPEAILNIAMLLGWSPKSITEEKFSVDEIINEFDPKDFNKSNSNFNEEKFNWLAGMYIREADLDRLLDIAIPFLKNSGYISDEKNVDREYYKSIIDSVRSHMKCMAEIINYIDFFFADKFDNMKVEGEAKELLTKDTSIIVFKSFIKNLENIDEITKDNFNPIFKEVQKETKVKGKDLFMPVRIALTKQMHGPELFLITPIIGKNECIRRLKLAYE